jgi:hypothetical protein
VKDRYLKKNSLGEDDKEYFSVDRANKPGTRNDDANTVLYDLKPGSTT